MTTPREIVVGLLTIRLTDWANGGPVPGDDDLTEAEIDLLSAAWAAAKEDGDPMPLYLVLNAALIELGSIYITIAHERDEDPLELLQHIVIDGGDAS